MAMTQILVATPSRDQTVAFPYVKSLFDTLNWFKERDRSIAFSLKLGSFSSVDAARNYFATLVLEQEHLTHLLFIDSDHGYPPELISDMLALDKPVVGVVYPARHLSFRHLHEQARRVEDPKRLEALQASYVRPDFVRTAEGKVEIVHGFARVSVVGTGIMLIQRRVFDEMAGLPDMIGRGHKLLQEQGFSGRVLQCFRPIVSEENVPMGEDVSFCKRWVEQCAGEIWANVGYETSHMGPYWFKGRFIDRYS